MWIRARLCLLDHFLQLHLANQLIEVDMSNIIIVTIGGANASDELDTDRHSNSVLIWIIML